MRLFIVPVILAALLMQAPDVALGNENQEAADKIINAIDEHFPDAYIEVAFQGGKVLMKGEASSEDQKMRILELASGIPGVEVKEIKENIQVVAAMSPTLSSVVVAKPNASPITAPIPMPNSSATRGNTRTPVVAMNTRQNPPSPPQSSVTPNSIAPKAATGEASVAHPHQQYPAAYGMNPDQQSANLARYAPNQYQMQNSLPIPMGQANVAYAGQHQPAYHGQQNPLPGRYNQPNLPDHAWPAYANYPNYAQVSYPRAYSPKAWPYIGPYYPYPQVPLGWRKVTLEHHNGWWWLDFDDGTPSGPFSGLFRQPQQYTY